MGDPLFVRRFGRSGRPGAYLRIVEEGDVGAGDAIEVHPQTEHDISLRFMSHAILTDHSLLPELRAIPGLIPEWHEWIDQRGG